MNQRDRLFDLGFKGFEFDIHGAHYRGKNVAWSRTKPLFSKWFIALSRLLTDALQHICM
jgi:hypothetical protein